VFDLSAQGIPDRRPSSLTGREGEGFLGKQRGTERGGIALVEQAEMKGKKGTANMGGEIKKSCESLSKGESQWL